MLALPASAAKAPHLSRSQAISIAAAEARIQALVAESPGAHWEASFDRRSRRWTAVLERAHRHSVLASVTIADATGVVVRTHVVSALGPPRLDAGEATLLARRVTAVRSWLSLYRHVTHGATLGDDRVWTVHFYGGGHEVAQVHVDDGSEQVATAWTGPQVGWQLVRGEPQSYGRKVNEPYIFLPLCAIFLAGLVDWRRPLAWRTLDLLVLLSFGISLFEFNRGHPFLATPLIYPPLVYLAARMAIVGAGRRAGGRRAPIGPRHTLVLVALLFGLVGFRLGLNNQDSNILDVGYAGVAGADRLLNGTLPYGHMPSAHGRPCGGRYQNGDPIGYVQRIDGRCETPIERGDTYGPTVYVAYTPAVAALGWSGKWDDLPAAHVAASAFDLLAIAGLVAAGWALAGPSLGVLLAFGWAANPFTLYALNMNTNDALVGALVAWTIAALARPSVRGALLAAAALTKFAPLALVPLFASLRSRFATLVAFAATALVLLSMLALDADGLRLFWNRTIDYQLHRVTPMSIWTLPAYHPGWPELRLEQRAVELAAVALAVLWLVYPRRKDAASVAALGAATLIAVQLAGSYWFYPYICWWLPLVLAALFLPRAAAPRAAPQLLAHAQRLD